MLLAVTTGADPGILRGGGGGGQRNFFKKGRASNHADSSPDFKSKVPKIHTKVLKVWALK